MSVGFVIFAFILILAFLLVHAVEGVYRRVYGDQAVDNYVHPHLRWLFPPPVDQLPALKKKVIVHIVEVDGVVVSGRVVRGDGVDEEEPHRPADDDSAGWLQ